MRIDPSQTLNTHDAEHFLLALAATKDAAGLTGNDVDRLCFFPLGTTGAILRKERVVHLRYVQRYCKDLGMDPEKPWGIDTCKYCAVGVTDNGMTPNVSGSAVPDTARIREGLLRMIEECVMLFFYAEGVEGVAPSYLKPIAVLWGRMDAEERTRFLREVLCEDEVEAVVDAFLEGTTRCDVLGWAWPHISTEDRMRFLRENLTPTERWNLQYGMKKEDSDAHHAPPLSAPHDPGHP